MDNKLIDSFSNTIDTWITELEHYSFPELTATPFTGGWSMGQLYMHLILETNFYIEQIHSCISSNANAAQPLGARARELFIINSFPDEKIEGPPSNAFVPQPGSKQQLVQALGNVKAAMNAAAVAISASQFHGKTQHPGFNYLTAAEWLQLADIHLRHHLRQKKRLDANRHQRDADGTNQYE